MAANTTLKPQTALTLTSQVAEALLNTPQSKVQAPALEVLLAPLVAMVLRLGRLEVMVQQREQPPALTPPTSLTRPILALTRTSMVDVDLSLGLALPVLQVVTDQVATMALVPRLAEPTPDPVTITHLRLRLAPAVLDPTTQA